MEESNKMISLTITLQYAIQEMAHQRKDFVEKLNSRMFKKIY